MCLVAGGEKKRCLFSCLLSVSHNYGFSSCQSRLASRLASRGCRLASHLASRGCRLASRLASRGCRLASLRHSVVSHAFLSGVFPFVLA